MTDAVCAYCALPAEVRAAIDPLNRQDASAYAKANGHKLSEISVRRHRAGCGQTPTETAPVTAMFDLAKPAYVELGPDTGEIYTGMLDKPISTHEDVLRALGVDPGKWSIVDETVRISRYQQGYKDNAGVGQVQWLHALRARITTRKAACLTDEDMADLRKAVRMPPRGHVSHAEASGTLVVCLADPQIGNGENGGVEATLTRLAVSLAEIVEHVKKQRKAGRPPERIILALLGDLIEGVAGQYASQTYTVQANLRQQLILAIDLCIEYIRQLAALTDKLDVLTVPSNHGEWTRNGGKRPITDDSDNADNFIGDTLQRIYADRADYAHVTFHNPDEDPTVTLTLSGVPVAFAHSHKAPSGSDAAIKKWLDGQNEHLIYNRGFMPRLWILGHLHHLVITDHGKYHVVQCPASDNGSKWLLDSAGKWAHPGVLVLTVTDADPRGWQDLAIY